MLAAVLSSALSEHRGHDALVYAEAKLSFAELAAAADRLAAALALREGERVAIVSPNVPALVVAMVAAWRAGAVAVPLSARLRRFELERAFADAEPAVAVSVDGRGGSPLADELPNLQQRTASLRAFALLDELGELQDHRQFSALPGTASPGDLAAILYTSGTTGEPKGALVPHALAAAMGGNLAELLGDHAEAPAALAVPASHAFGLGCLLAGLLAGAAVVMIEVSTSVSPLLDALRAHGVGVLHSSPALLGRVQRAGGELTLRAGLVAGSRCPPDLLRALDDRAVRILNLYGLTETGAVSACRQEDEAPTRYHTVGGPLPGYELRIAAGEVQVRSALLPAGYQGHRWDEELTEDGWFRTGDLGELDAAGRLTIAGRAKEVVHVGGFNVFPAEVESFLLTHPAIVQAAVLGVPHQALGEALEAFIVPAPGAELAPRDVIRFARGGIAGYKVPYAVQIVDELPLLPSGKPDRGELARAAQLAEVK